MDKSAILGILAIVSLSLCVTFASAQTPTVNCTLFPRHTLCLNSTCALTQTQTLTVAQQNQIVSVHNQVRDIVASGLEFRGQGGGGQPAATDPTSMQLISWSDDLAFVAQKWANQCIFYNDDMRNTTVNAVGQNMFARLDWANDIKYPTNTTYLRYAISTWWAEVDQFNGATVPSYVKNAKARDYSQLVWGNTTQVGCGFAQWNYVNNRVARSLVCNYSPGGNVVGSPVYT